jgi:DHA1 family bicyclomycin/chloramphenicol resistance-like MFS transporter
MAAADMAETVVADVAVGAPAVGLARSAKAPVGFIILLGALTAFGPISIDMYLPSLPGLARSLHASDAAAQLTVAAFFIGISVGQLFYGPLSDRFGRRPPILFGISLYLAATLGCAFAPTIETLILCRVLQALGGCAGMVIARAVVRDRFAPEEVLHVFSLLMLVMGLAPILAPLMGGAVLLVGDWRWIFAIQAVFAAVMGVCVFLGLKESRSAATAAHARSENPFQAYAALLGHPKLVGYLMSGACSGAALFTYVSSSPAVLIGYFHIAPQAFGWVFGLNAIGLIGATQINARLARRTPSDVILGRANLFLLAVAIVLCVCAITGFGGIFGVLGPLFLIMSGLGFNQANASTGALNVDPRRSGATAALLGASLFAVGAAASAVAGALQDGTARPMAIVIAVSFLASVVCLQTLVLRKR